MKTMKKLLALLLAMAMLFALCACGGDDKKDSKTDKKDKTTQSDKDSDNDPETIAETFAQRMTESDYKAIFDLCAFDLEESLKDELLADYDDEDELFEELSDEYGEDIDSWKDIYAFMQTEQQDSLADQYGEDYKVKTKILDTAELDEDELDNVKDYLLEEWGDYIDEDEVEDISKGMDVTIKVTVKGDEDEDSTTYTITMVKCDGEWKVADYSEDYEDEDYDDEATTIPPTTQTKPSTTQPKPTTTQPTEAPVTTLVAPLGSWVCDDVTMTFAFDGTGSLSDVYGDAIDFTWKFQNGNLHILTEEGEEAVMRYTIEGDTLTLINEDGETLEWTKKTASDSGTQTAVSPAGVWESDGITMILLNDGTGSLSNSDEVIAITWEVVDGKLYLFSEEGDILTLNYDVNGNTLTIHYDDGTDEVWTKQTLDNNQPNNSANNSALVGSWVSDDVTMTLRADGSGYIMVGDMSLTLEWASVDNLVAFLMSGEEYYGEYVISGKTLTIYYDDGAVEVWTKK